MHVPNHPLSRQQRVVVGMSGGVDSAVAALLLLEKGFHVEALFMKNWEEDDDAAYCAAETDLKDATEVCDRLGIQLHTANFSHEYWERVFKTFLTEYRAGRTPNPDVICNKEIKFKAFLDHALMLDASSIATGHYARITRRGQDCQLRTGIDIHKDQSYFLYQLGQHELRHSHFPLGEMTKPRVRELAKKSGFANHDKKDSTGICFIGERRFRDFLSRYLPAQPGEIIDMDGRSVGRHSGLMFYTLGQRQGLGIGGRKNASEEPWYVVQKDIPKNTLIVAQGHHHAALYHSNLVVDQPHWINHPPPSPFRCQAKIRYRQHAQACVVTTHDAQIRVTFDVPQRAITPGQSVVFYDNDSCIGGGIIEGNFTQEII